VRLNPFTRLRLAEAVIVSTPTPPDPLKTAAAQSGINVDTALSQQLVNHTNQVGPWGSTTYNPTGNSSFVNSQGQTINIPQYTQTTTYNPAQQAIFDKTTQAQSNLAGLAQDQSAKMAQYLNKPFSFNNQDAANWSYDLASSRILPQQEQARFDLQTRLTNQGIRPGTTAYDREMTRQTQGNTDQMNQLALNGRSQAFGEAVQTRNQPINELSGLLSSSQIAGPSTGNPAASQAQVGGVDYTGLVNNNYNQQVAANGSMMGGLFGLAGAGISAFGPKISDRRMKKNINRVGTLDNGLPVYSYNYIWGGPVEIGVIAQDVEQFRPEAVSQIGGIKAVDYARATA
jgi:hypothetical protein